MAEMTAEVTGSLMRALWGEVTADLRGVAVSHSGSPRAGTIRARFLYEGDVGELQAECTSLAETSCMADFGAGVSVAFTAVPNAPRTLMADERWIYLRWEPDQE